MPDLQLRQQLERQAEHEDLTSTELRELVQQAREKLEPHQPTDGKPTPPPRLLTPKRGTLGLYRITMFEGALHLDLGFEAYRPLTASQRQRFTDGQIVRRESDGTLTHIAEATGKDLYTYGATVLRVVDGDTVWVALHLSPIDSRQEKLRLRGIDCRERGTAGGDAATRYVQTLLREAKQIVITSTKPDKWDRYLCDVYLTPAEGPEIFLNNRLLELGLARRYDDVAPEDWEV